MTDAQELSETPIKLKGREDKPHWVRFWIRSKPKAKITKGVGGAAMGGAAKSVKLLFDLILDRRNRFQVIRDGQSILLGHALIAVLDDFGHESLHVVHVRFGAVYQ